MAHRSTGAMLPNFVALVVLAVASEVLQPVAANTVEGVSERSTPDRGALSSPLDLDGDADRRVDFFRRKQLAKHSKSEHSASSISNVKAKKTKEAPTDQVSLQTCFACVVATAGAIVAVVLFNYRRNVDSPGVAASESMADGHSFLLDNARVLAQFLVVYTHFLYYNVDTAGVYSYHDCETWLHGATYLMTPIISATSVVKMPMICFISGVCTQSDITPLRLRRYITRLLIPTLLWVFIVKPVVFDSLRTLDPMTLITRMQQMASLQTFHEEWYLQALCIWRGTSFLVWLHMRPAVAFSLMMALSCIGGYFKFTWFLKLDETLGFLPYFAFGLIFPYKAMTNFFASPHYMFNILMGVLVVCWCVFVIPGAFPEPLPDGHGPYTGNASGPLFLAAVSWERKLWWTRRVANLVMEMIPTLGLLFFVIPRQRTPLSWIGEHTLYPFLFHLSAHSCRDRLVVALSLPVVKSPSVHVLVLFLHVFYSVGVLAFFASEPFRRIFDWCLKPVWVETLLFKSVEATESHVVQNMGHASAGTGEPGEEFTKLLHTCRNASDIELAASLLAPSNEVKLRKKTTGMVASVSKPISMPLGTTGRSPSNSDSSPSSPSMRSSRMIKAGWRGDKPTWVQGARIPQMSQAREFYKILLPLFTVYVLATTAGPLYMLTMLHETALRLIADLPMWAFVLTITSGLVSTSVVYAYHFLRLRDAMALARADANRMTARDSSALLEHRRALLHTVVVVAYKEPIDVVVRTFASIMDQQDVKEDMCVVFATEVRDPTRHETAAVLRRMVSKHPSARFILTEHELTEGETAGKSSNENYAVREVHRILSEEGHDPFEVMITIVDADSVLSSRYLSNVESHFHAQPDGRRLIYSGPLNVYRNLADGCLLAQMHDISRCHQDVFFKPWKQYHPQSNYSLTLGLAAEIDFWTPDNMPEDVHTAAKVRLVSFGSWATVPIEGVICNDMVCSFWDRYVQAKRHQWGITDFAWQLAIFKSMTMSFYTWFAQFRMDIKREGSYVATANAVSGTIVKVFVFTWLTCFAGELPERVHTILMGFCVLGFWRLFCFWVAELVLWRTLLTEFDIKRPSALRWVLLVVLSPVLLPLGDILYFITPTLDCLFHAAFIGELNYVCAPKGDLEEERDTQRTTLTDDQSLLL